MDREKQILLDRAKKAAGKITDYSGWEPGFLTVIEFTLWPEKYAVEESYVGEVFTLNELTPIPGTPPFIMGVYNLRGRIVSVVNLKMFLGIHEKGLTELNKVILLQLEDGFEFGIVVDRIEGNSWIKHENLSAPPLTLSGPETEFISGIRSDGLIVLNAFKLLKSAQLIVNQKTNII